MSSNAPLSVKGVVLDAGGRVLLCRNHRDEWELPGGRPAAGEEPTACLLREILEETGVSVQVRERIGNWPFEAVPGRWVRVVAFGCCATSSCDIVHVSAEHVDVGFHCVDEVERLPDGYRHAVRRWTAMSRGRVLRRPMGVNEPNRRIV